MKPVVHSAAIAVCLLALAASARAAEPAQPAEPAESAPTATWDHAKVLSLAQQLETVTGELFQAMRRMPQPMLGNSQRLPFYRLTQKVRQLRRESRSLSNQLEQGGDREQTQPSYESMMETVRAARVLARRVSPPADVNDRATAALALLNQLAPFYDNKAQPLEPVGRDARGQ
jgi:hypothetical protein